MLAARAVVFAFGQVLLCGYILLPSYIAYGTSRDIRLRRVVLLAVYLLRRVVGERKKDLLKGLEKVFYR